MIFALRTPLSVQDSFFHKASLSASFPSYPTHPIFPYLPPSPSASPYPRVRWPPWRTPLDRAFLRARRWSSENRIFATFFMRISRTNVERTAAVVFLTVVAAVVVVVVVVVITIVVVVIPIFKIYFL